MNKWIKSLVPLGIAGILLTIVAIGFGAQSGLAVKPSAEPTVTSGCMGEEPEAVRYHDRANSTDEYQFDFCSDPTLMLTVHLSWDNAKKDLDLHVTAPDGTVYVKNGAGGTSHIFYLESPLTEGTWMVEVVNNGNGSVAYDLAIGLVVDPGA